MVGEKELSIDNLCDVSDWLQAGNSIDEISRRTTESAGELFGCAACDLFLMRDGGLALESTFRSNTNEPELPISRPFAIRTYRKQDPQLIEEISNEEQFKIDSKYKSLLAVPLGDYGVLQIADREANTFDERFQTLVDIFGGSVTQVLSRAQEDSPIGIPPNVAAEFVETAEMMMIAIDPEGTITFVNRRAREVLGYEQGELPGRDWFETCIPEHDHKEIRTVFEQLVSGEVESAEQVENTIVTKDGDERLVEWHNAILETASGEITGTLSAGQDITDQKQTEQRVIEEREKYRTLVEQFPNGLVTLFDEQHRFQVVGGTGLEQLGISAEDLEGQHLEEVFPPENVASLEPLFEQAFEGESGTVDVTLEDRVFRVRVVPVCDENGEAFAGMTISQDVTQQKAYEEELKAAKKRYRTLLQAAPDPVFVADADSGEILEVNEAAERLRDQPSEEIVGCHQEDLHPPGQAEAYQNLFKNHVAEGGRRRRLEDNSHIYAVTGDGGQVPVEISVETVEIDGKTRICGIFRDVSDQLEYELALRKLNEATREFFTAEGSEEICQRAVETVTDLLDQTGATVNLVDETEAVLHQVAGISPPGVGEAIGEQPTFEPGESVAWRVFTEGETEVFADVRGEKELHNPDTPIQSEIIVPLGSHGVLVAGKTEPNAFDDRAVQLLEILGETVEAALDRTEREQQLKRRQDQLEQQTREFEELEEIHDRVRNVAKAVVNSKSREEIEKAVCSELVGVGSVTFAWIGDVDPIEESLVPRAWAGEPQGYLQNVSRSLQDETSSEPALRAARTREPASISNTTLDLSAEPWRDQAIRRGFNSVLSIPLLYQESFHGVLTLYATDQAAFPERLQSVLTELGNLVANAAVAINRSHAILSNRATELEFDIQDQSCFFLRFTQETGCTLDLDEVVPQSDGSWLVFVRVSERAPEDLIDDARHAPDVDAARLIDTDDDALVQLRFTRPFIASKLADSGMAVRNISADGKGCRVTVAVPPTVSIHQATDVITSLYSGSELIAKREQMQQHEEGGVTQQILDSLTSRQHEVLSIAYHQGYFNDPRDATGAEVAEDLGFSPSAFHRHVREVERKIFEILFNNDTGPLDSSSDPAKN